MTYRPGRPGRALVAAAFFVSGATALAAQVVLARLLSYVFGSSHLATSTVLAAYMLGLSLGALVAGRLSRRFTKPLKVYASLELAVGVFFAMTPTLFLALSQVGLTLGRSWADSAVVLTGIRFLLSLAFVVVPTLLMGGTLPTLLAAFRGEEALERHLPNLYAVNTLGAATGTLLAAYVWLPRLGLDGTLQLCALLNALIAAAAFLLSFRVEGRGAAPEPLAPTLEATGPGPNGGGFSPSAVCSFAFLQGVTAFVLEVTWSHLIGTVVGVTVYAFALMLSAILVGIGLGSLSLPALRRATREPPAALFTWAQLLLALSLLVSLFFWDRFPDVINHSLRLKPHWSFAEREVVRFLFVMVLLLPSTFAMGVALPALTMAVVPESRRGARGDVGAWVGTVFAANTVGAILGALACGFVLMGRVSSASILVITAAMAFLLACYARLADRSLLARSRTSFVMTGVACVALAAAFPGWNASRLTAGSHYYWQPWAPSRSDPILFLAEDAQVGFITVERSSNGTKVMKTNGKYEGSDEALEFQDHIAFLGGLYAKSFRRAVIVGLGPGRALALLHEMPFERIELVEFSPTVLAAARQHFPDLVAAPFADPRVHVVEDDGRNYLQLASPGYDYVGVGITGAAFAGVGNLYTHEFFSAVRSRLASKGVFVLWLQLHHVRPREVGSVVYTLRSVFGFVHMYATPDGKQGFLVASSQPLSIDSSMMPRLSASPRAGKLLAVARMRSLAELTSLNVFTTDDEIVSFLESSATGRPVRYADFNPGFEYATPKGLAEPIAGLNLQPFSKRRLPTFDPPLAPGEEAGLRGLRFLVAGDLKTALDEFDRAERLLGEPRWGHAIAEIRSLSR